jgi:hypothetical protein
MVIDWPSTHGHPICLRALGDVVRSHDKKIAARMTFHRMGIEKAASTAVNAASSSGM